MTKIESARVLGTRFAPLITSPKPDSLVEGYPYSEATGMISKVTCEHCKGVRYIKVTTPTGHVKHAPCPHCAGKGYQVRTTR